MSTEVVNKVLQVGSEKHSKLLGKLQEYYCELHLAVPTKFQKTTESE